MRGSPTYLTNNLPRPMTDETGTCTLSTDWFASPFVVRVPSGLIATTRCDLMLPIRSGSGSWNTVTRPSNFCGLCSGEARITSPTLIRGAIDPDSTT